jgi:hypothetical protein
LTDKSVSDRYNFNSFKDRSASSGGLNILTCHATEIFHRFLNKWAAKITTFIFPIQMFFQIFQDVFSSHFRDTFFPKAGAK